MDRGAPPDRQQDKANTGKCQPTGNLQADLGASPPALHARMLPISQVNITLSAANRSRASTSGAWSRRSRPGQRWWSLT